MAMQFAQRIAILLALLSVLSIGMTTASAATSAEIRYAQQQLQMLGYQLGEADGLMGPRTRAAVKKYQQDSLLPTTGTLGPLTKAQLRNSLPDFPSLAEQRRRPGESKRFRKTNPPEVISRLTEATTSREETAKPPTDPRRIPGSTSNR